MNLRKFNKNLKKEFNNTFEEEIKIVEPIKQKRRLNFKPIFAFSMAILWGLLIVEHIGVQIYNSTLKNQSDKIVNKFDGELVEINTKKNIKSQLNFTKGEKDSILSSIFSMGFIGCGGKDVMYPTSPDFNGSINEGTSDDAENSYNTNVQEEGIDEANTVKCDGKYIYSTMGNGTLYIYDLTGKTVAKTETAATQIYLYNDKIIGTSYNNCQIYEFNGEELNLIDTIDFGNRYHDSRLINNQFFIVTYKYLNNILNGDFEDNVYYDNCINPTGVISMHKYDLDTQELKSIDVITSYQAILYASENNFFISSINYANGHYSFISIIDYDLNPVGSVKIEGSVLNQFSMDEHNNHLRVVSTDRTKGPLNINQISIFNLDTLERVGYLNEGIGLEGHTVRSVRYDGDTCYIVTYMNKDPLYEIDLSDVTNPKIVSIYESPGYSSYLHTFEIDGQKYAFGIGYDDIGNMKISVYIDNGDETIQIGKDVIVVETGYIYNQLGVDFYVVERPDYIMANNHKSLFIYNDGTYLYIGGYVGSNQFTIFKVDVTQKERVIDIYKEYKNINCNWNTRGLLINSKFYVVEFDRLIIDDWS